MPFHRPVQAVLRVAVLALWLGSLSVHAQQAPRLGALFVLSERNLPFEALVEVEDPEGVLTPGAPALAPPATYAALGLPYPALLQDATVALEKRASDGRSEVRIRATRPADRPDLAVVLSLTTPNGRQVRSYRLDLDTMPVGGPGVARLPWSPTPSARVEAPRVEPPRVQAPSAEPPRVDALRLEAAPQAVASPAQNAPAPGPRIEPLPSVSPVQTLPSASASVPAVRPLASTPSAEATAPATFAAESVRVESGDTIASIAQRIKPAGVTEAQAALALYRNNPEAFAGSVHRLQQGALLTVPTPEQMRALPAGIAESSYRPERNEPIRERPVPLATRSVARSGDRLDLDESGAVRTGRTVKPASRASRDVAFDVAMNEARARITQLEKIVTDMQAMIALRDQQMAALNEALKRAQRIAEGGAAEPAPAAATPVPAPAAPIPGASATMLPESTRSRAAAAAIETPEESPGLPVAAIIAAAVAALIVLLAVLLRRRRRAPIDDPTTTSDLDTR